MNNWKTRLVEERDALGEKIISLGEYLKNSKEIIYAHHFDLLEIQYKAMQTYYEVLQKRVLLINKDQPQIQQV